MKAKAIDRLYIYMDSKGIKPAQAERDFSLSNGYLSKQKKRGGDLGESVLLSILENSPDLSPEWLLTGEGEMNRTPEEARIPTYDNMRHMSEPEVREFPLKSRDAIVEQQSIPLYSFEATASILAQGDVSEFILDRIHIPRMPKCDGAVIVSGDSMKPIIESGDIVLFKTYENFDSIIFGQMYLVSLLLEGDTLILIKYVRKVDGDDSSVMLCSENPAHEPMKVKLANIRHIALIKGSIRYHTM